MLERYIKRPFFFFREVFEVSFHINMKKMKNQASNEIFRQNNHDPDLVPKRNLRPMDAKGLMVNCIMDSLLSQTVILIK